MVDTSGRATREERKMQQVRRTIRVAVAVAAAALYFSGLGTPVLGFARYLCLWYGGYG
jgi:hypothetical protein